MTQPPVVNDQVLVAYELSGTRKTTDHVGLDETLVSILFPVEDVVFLRKCSSHQRVLRREAVCRVYHSIVRDRKKSAR